MIANHQQKEMTLGEFVMFVYNTCDESKARAFVCFAVQSRLVLFSYSTTQMSPSQGAQLQTS